MDYGIIKKLMKFWEKLQKKLRFLSDYGIVGKFKKNRVR